MEKGEEQHPLPTVVVDGCVVVVVVVGEQIIERASWVDLKEVDVVVFVVVFVFVVVVEKN